MTVRFSCMLQMKNVLLFLRWSNMKHCVSYNFCFLYWTIFIYFRQWIISLSLVLALTSACEPADRVLLHFAHLRHGRCQSFPSEVTFSARKKIEQAMWPIGLRHALFSKKVIRNCILFLSNCQATLKCCFQFQDFIVYFIGQYG